MTLVSIRGQGRRDEGSRVRGSSVLFHTKLACVLPLSGLICPPRVKDLILRLSKGCVVFSFMP
jgi:hypothetical protein